MEVVKLTDKQFEKVSKIVYDMAGIYLPPEKLSLLSNRLRKRLRALDFETYEEYIKLVSTPSGMKSEMPHFLSAVTTNETYFFRNDGLWKLFKTEFIQYFVDTKTGSKKNIRIWSAASSSGEEAYTAAISLREHLPDFSSWKISIIGSDISSNVLDKARAGVYNDYALSKMPPAMQKRWFTSKDGSHQLCDEIMKMVRFQFHNLRDPFTGGSCDLVFLRNVLMYFDNPMKKRVLKTVCDALAPGGFLIVGDVDPIRTTPELSKSMTCDYERPGVYRKPGQKASSVSQKEMVTT